MGNVRVLILAAMVGTLPRLAIAADMLPPPPPIDAPVLRGTVEPSGWYLRGDVGVGINTITSKSSTFAPGSVVPGFRYDQANLGDSPLIGIGAGYQFNSWLRADITGEYRGSANYNAVASFDGSAFTPNPCGGTGRCPDTYTGNVSEAVFLANGYVDIGTWAGLTPYIGAGVGLANWYTNSWTDHSIGNTGGGFANGTSGTNFAWAAMAGVSYQVNRNLKLELGYRYLDMGAATSGPIICQPVGVAGCTREVQKLKIASQDIRLGMRWLLNADEPVPMYAPALPSQPLVRKY